MAITDWPESERPHEKLLAAGASGLSDAELLAIFLRTGVRGMTAVDLARDLMRRFGSLRALLTASREEFCITKGLGEAKYVQLQAVMEMARRQLSEILVRGDALSSPQAAADYLRASRRKGIERDKVESFRKMAEEAMRDEQGHANAYAARADALEHAYHAREQDIRVAYAERDANEAMLQARTPRL